MKTTPTIALLISVLTAAPALAAAELPVKEIGLLASGTAYIEQVSSAEIINQSSGSNPLLEIKVSGIYSNVGCGGEEPAFNMMPGKIADGPDSTEFYVGVSIRQVSPATSLDLPPMLCGALQKVEFHGKLRFHAFSEGKEAHYVQFNNEDGKVVRTLKVTYEPAHGWSANLLP